MHFSQNGLYLDNGWSKRRQNLGLTDTSNIHVCSLNLLCSRLFCGYPMKFCLNSPSLEDG